MEVALALNGIRQLVRVLRLGSTATEQATGLSSAQLFVLQQLAESEATSVNSLAERTLTDQSSVSVVVSRLVTKGLVERLRSPDDARRVSVRITEAGMAVLGKAPPTLQTQLIQVLRSMPPQSLHAFVHELTHIVTQLGAANEPPTMFFEDDATGAR